MDKRLTIILLILILFSHFLNFSSVASAKSGNQTETYIVGLKNEINLDSFIEQKGIKGKNPQKIKFINGLVLDLSSSELQSLQQSTEISFIEKDSVVAIASIGNINTQHKLIQELKKDSQIIPWGIHDIGVELALDNNSDGKSIKVAILDTGVADHPDLKVAKGVSFVEGTGNYTDDNGHGTHVAGTIAALNNKMGVLGAAPKSNIYAVKVLDHNGSGNYSQVIQGIEWAIDNNMDVISMSFGGTVESKALQESIKKATNQGLLIISAAGNRGFGEETELYPARYPEVISVGAVDSLHKRAPFSSTGSEIDLVAPGVDILSTTLDGNYGVLSGTSMATPHVTGAAAALWSKFPQLTNQEIREKLLQNASPLGDPQEYGFGLVNLTKALGIDTPHLEQPEPPKTEEPVGPIIPPEELTPSSYINRVDFELLELSDQLLHLKKRAMYLDELKLDNEIEQTFHDLNAKSTELHRLPEQFNSNETNDSEGSYQNTQALIDEYFEAMSSDFDQLKEMYRQSIITYSSKLPDEINQQSEVNSLATTDLLLNSPIDVDLASGISQVYHFTPSTTGNYIFFTSPYENIGSSNDTVLELYSDAALTSRIAYNDDSNGTLFSQIKIYLTSGTSYYVKLRHCRVSDAVHAKLTVTNTPQIMLNGYVDVSIRTPAYQKFLFIPRFEGIHRIFTGPYGGTGSSNDTVLDIFTDSGLTNFITSNNNAYGLEFSEIISTLKQGVPYYVRLRPYSSSGTLHTRISVVPYVAPTDIMLKTPIDVNISVYQHKLFKFTPSSSGNYMVYTDYFGGTSTSGSSNTTLAVSKYENMIYPLASNDNYNGTTFSKINVNMTRDRVYYIKLAGYINGSVHARIVIEASGYSHFYDSSGRLDYILSPSGQTLDFQYDNNGNLVKKILLP